jgi:ABC-2 type transport system ATP-binding protein
MIAVQGLTKYYGDQCAIADLDFEIQRGEIVGILGLNGAGKTTTLRILACLLLPSSGRVTIHDLDIYDNPHEIRKQVGFLPEEPPLYREMSVSSYLTFAAELRGLSRADARSRVEEVMELTATREVGDVLISNLSHGFRKRVGIGQSIVHKPPVLILDEPISGLDPVQIVEMREMILALRGKHTIIVSSHILPEISQTCDRILVIQDGRLVATGTEEELTGRLTGAHRLEVHVRGNRDMAVALIKEIDGVVSCEPRDSSESVHELRVEAEKDVREALSQEIVQSGMGLLQLSPGEAELEAIFLQLTHSRPGKKPAAAAGKKTGAAGGSGKSTKEVA